MEYKSWIPMADERKDSSVDRGFSTDWRDCPEMEEIRKWLREKMYVKK